MSWLSLAHFVWISASLAVFGLALFPIYARREPKRVRQLMTHLAILVLIAGLAAVSLYTAQIGASWVDIAAASMGRTWLTQIVLAALLYFAVRRQGSAPLTLLAGANVIGFALVGHANAISGAFGAFVQAGHLLAAGGWLGGAVALTYALGEAAPGRVVARFSWMGVIFVTVIGVTGFALLDNNTGALLPLTQTRYGQLAVLKITGFAAALACAAFNRSWAGPNAAWRVMAGVIFGELALLLLIVAAAVLLAQSEPYG
jgi:putative copper export protein